MNKKNALLILLLLIASGASMGNEFSYDTDDESCFEDISLDDIEVGQLELEIEEKNERIEKEPITKERRVCMISSDLISVGASTLYCSYYPSKSATISQIGSALYAVNFAFDHILDLPNQIGEISGESTSNLNKLNFILSQCGEAASISGFTCLALNDHLKVGSWLIAAGLSTRVLTGSYRIASYGLEQVYGHQDPLLNFFLRMLFENSGGTVGSYVLGIGACMDSKDIDRIGSLIVGSSVGLGSVCVLASNLYYLCQSK